MIPQYDNLVTSSFLLWLDNKILTNGLAYQNVDSKLYPSTARHNGYYQYNFPFSQLVSDFSVPGNPQIPTGLYLNSVFCPVNTSGLVSIDFNRGAAYFSTGLASNIQVSGRYAIKDFNVTLPRVGIEQLFQTKLELRSKINQNINSFTGLGNNEMTYPSIFIRSFSSESKPYCFGGIKDIKNHIGCFIFASNQFLSDASASLLRDLEHEYVPLLDSSEYPFNSLGGFKNNVPFSYTGITQGKIAGGSGIFVSEVFLTDFSRRSLDAEIQILPPEVFFRVAEFELSLPRLT